MRAVGAGSCDPSLSFPVPGGRVPRFDPTAFVKAKEKKQKEIKMKLAPLLPHLLLLLPPALAVRPVFTCPCLPPVSIICPLLVSPFPRVTLGGSPALAVTHREVASPH